MPAGLGAASAPRPLEADVEDRAGVRRIEPIDATDRRFRSAKSVAAPLAGCLLLGFALAFVGLGVRPLISPAEARYAMVAREMAKSGDWIQPRFNHVRFEEKPPLTYWCVAAAYELLGDTEFASRLPSALAYVGTTLLTFLLALELAGRRAAPLASLVYATALGPFLFGRFLFTDTLLVLWLTLSLYGLARILRRGSDWVGPWLFWAGASLAVLTKGLIGLVFPLAAAVVCAMLRMVGAGFVRRLRPWLGACVVAVLVLPWHLAMARRDPGFVRFYFGGEHIARFLSRRQPVNYSPLSVPAFWVSTLLWMFPWSLFLPAALRDLRRRRCEALVWIWAAGVVLFFTLTPSRIEYYGLPALPALAVIVGAAWSRLSAAGTRVAVFGAPSLFIAALGLAVGPLVFAPHERGLAALSNLVASLDGYYREYFGEHPGASMVFGAELLRLARPFPLALLATGVGTFLLLRRRRRPARAFALWAGGAVAILVMADSGMRLIAQDRSQRAAARIVEESWTPSARLVVAGDYEEACGITFYTGRPTSVVDGPGADLTYGYRHGDAPEIFLSPADFLTEWDSNRCVFVVGGRDLSLPGATVLFEGPRSRVLVRDRCPASDETASLDHSPGAGATAAPQPDRDRRADSYF